MRNQIWACLARLRALNQLILIIDKHLKKLSLLSDRFYVLERGYIVWSGTNADL